MHGTESGMDTKLHTYTIAKKNKNAMCTQQWIKRSYYEVIKYYGLS